MTINFHPPRNIARRNLLAVYVSAFFASLGFSFLTPLLPLFTLELLDGNLSRVGLWVGIAIGISPLLTAITGPLWGTIGDRLGQKRMLQRALIAIGISIALLAFIDHPLQLVGLRAAVGALGGISIATLAAVTSTSSKQTMGRNIGFLQAAQTLGLVAGPLVGGTLALAAGMRPTFLFSALLFALALGLVSWLYRDVAKSAPRAAEPKPAEAARPQPRLTGSFLFWATLGVLFSANFVDGSFMVLLPLYLPALGAPADSLALWAGLGLGSGALAMAVSATVAGRLSGRVPTGNLIVTMLFGAMLVLAAMVLATSWWQFIALRVLLGLVAGGLPTLAYAASAELVPANRRGAVVGMASSAGMLGWAVAPLSVGFLAGIDPHAVFFADMALVVLCGAALSLAGGAPIWRSLPDAARARLVIFSR